MFSFDFRLFEMEDCIICKETLNSEEPVVKLREKGSQGINNASRERGDTVVTFPGQSVHTGCAGHISTQMILRQPRYTECPINGYKRRQKITNEDFNYTFNL